jgi:hypothetical protein
MVYSEYMSPTFIIGSFLYFIGLDIHLFQIYAKVSCEVGFTFD